MLAEEGLSSSRAPCMNPQVFPLVQREPCPCDLYISRPIGDWSDCVLDRDIVTVSANGRPALGVCGSGSRYRRIGCYNKDNDLVEPSSAIPTKLFPLHHHSILLLAKLCPSPLIHLLPTPVLPTPSTSPSKTLERPSLTTFLTYTTF
uniref:Uncharacterized protein n=1 Tax=Timema monikensis TaxID=170555 RepID=A0A7R9HNS7_9NEOP|nr:unnamed protein product [Timema monikensis]